MGDVILRATVVSTDASTPVSALLVSALIVDAAIETFWHGSPVRWTVMAIAAAYVLTSALIWRHSTHRAKLTVSTLACALILAVSAWLPGGLDDGVRLLGLSTSTVLSLAAAIGIAIGGLVIAADSRLPRAARLIAAVLGGYGVVAFAEGILAGVAFGALFSGASLWRPLPLLLQGALIGGVIVVPTAIVTAVVRAGARRPASGSLHAAVHRVLGLVVILAIIIAGIHQHSAPLVSVGPAVARSEPTRTAPTPSRDQQNPTDVIKVLKTATLRVERTPAIEWDADVKATAFEDGIESAFRFVRDAIAYEPYSGVMRGAAGTYASRAGNAVDRALLLTRFLRDRAIHTRFAIGTLSESQRDQLLLRAFTRKPQGSLTAVPSSNDNSFSQRLFRRADRDYKAVRAVLGTQLAPVTAPSHEQLLAEMNPHVWVQASVNGGWVDLDPSFRDASVGHAPGTLVRTTEELPDDLNQRVTVRLMAETLVDDALKESPLLEVTRNVVDLVDRQVGVAHFRPPANTGLGAAIVGAVGGRPVHQRWKPILVIDGQLTFGESFDVDAPTFATEWIEFDLSWPDGRHEVTRRALVDRGSTAWRMRRPLDGSALHTLERGHAGPFALQALHNVWFSTGRHNLADFAVATLELTLDAARQSIQNTAANDSSGLAEEDQDLRQSLWPFALQNFSWMVWSDHILIPVLNDDPSVCLYPDGVRIALFSSGPAANDHISIVSDLRRDNLRGITNDDVKRGIIAEKKLRFGLLEGALEQEALAEAAIVLSGDVSGVDSTSNALSGQALRVVTAADATDVEHADLPSGVVTSLRAGRVIVTAARALPKHAAWWEIDRGTGDARPTGDLGLNMGTLMKWKGGIQGGKGGVVYTKEAADGIKKAQETGEVAKRYDVIKAKNAADPTRAMPKGGNALGRPSGGGGGMEYAVTLAVAVVHAIVFHYLSQMLLAKISSETDKAVEWFKAGGFSQ
jgi:transglutaminase-like putative cysteine protease